MLLSSKISLLALLVCFVAPAPTMAVAPTTKAAMQTEATLLTNWGKFLSWTEDVQFTSKKLKDELINCAKVSQAWKDLTCASVTCTSATSDKEDGCCSPSSGPPPYTLATKCGDASDDWKKKTRGDDSDGCCDVCIASDKATKKYAASCVPATFQGASVCGRDPTGNLVPDPTFGYNRGECSTGPSHDVTGQADSEGGVEGKCKAVEADFEAYYQKWATGSATGTKAYSLTDAQVEAWSTSDAEAYKAIKSGVMSEMTRAYVMNSANVDTSNLANMATVNLGKTVDGIKCAVGARSCHTEGTLKLLGGFAMVVNSVASKPGLLSIQGGNSKVIGCTNTGTLEVKSTVGVTRVADTTNSGTVTVTGGTDIFLSGITNNAGGTVLVTDTVASLYNIDNAADITMTGGTVHAYGIRNSGNITIKSGTVTLELLPAYTGPKCGTVIFEAGAKGTVTAPEGCTITKPATGVTVTYVSAGPEPEGATIRQSVAVTSVTTELYVGDLKAVYEAGYADAIGIFDVATKQIMAGNKVTSSAVAARRAGVKITFVAEVSPKYKAEATQASNLLKTTADALVGGIATASEALGKLVAVPTKSDITAEAAEITAEKSDKPSPTNGTGNGTTGSATQKATWGILSVLFTALVATTGVCRT